MAEFEDHISQAKRNIEFLHNINDRIESSFDWQVTTCFYSALHFINAHIAKKENQHFRSHKSVDRALNPYNSNPARLDDSTYLAYSSLYNLSLRSRYLVSGKNESDSQRSYLTHGKHLSKAIRHLNIIISYIISEYGIAYEKVALRCPEIKDKESIKNFSLTT